MSDAGGREQEKEACGTFLAAILKGFDKRMQTMAGPVFGSDGKED